MLNLILYSIATEAIITLFSKAIWFEPINRWAKKRGSKIGKDGRFIKGNIIARFLLCKYCQSVWAASLIYLVVRFFPYGWILVSLLVIHRMSNLVHIIFDWLETKRDKERVQMGRLLNGI
ncbi:MAG: DUF1360 domain-containing protein [Deltaproteobacteria bacterium]|nr:DUF1360 domain-containing protein [Deltaproteobacteria bacterium]